MKDKALYIPVEESENLEQFRRHAGHDVELLYDVKNYMAALRCKVCDSFLLVLDKVRVYT